MMGAEKARSDEALALERVAAAARAVQAASTALKSHFSADGGRQPSTLELARFAAAMQERRRRGSSPLDKTGGHLYEMRVVAFGPLVRYGREKWNSKSKICRATGVPTQSGTRSLVLTRRQNWTSMSPPRS